MWRRGREHVRRVHTKPAQCLTCGRRGDPGDIRTHNEKISCQQNNAIMVVDQETLRTDSSLTQTRNASWHRVFEMLFPNHSPPPSFNAQCKLSFLHCWLYVTTALDKYEDFDEIVETVEHVDNCRERLAQDLVACLNRSIMGLQQILNSPEYQPALSSGYRSPGTYPTRSARLGSNDKPEQISSSLLLNSLICSSLVSRLYTCVLPRNSCEIFLGISYFLGLTQQLDCVLFVEF